MFDAIKHHGSDGGLTSASYMDGEVQGYISFSSAPDRTGVISAIGPYEAVRECSISHWVGFGGRYRARARDEVSCYA